MLHSKLLWRIKFFCTGYVDKEKTLVRGKNVDSIPCVKLLVTALLLHINLAPQGLLTRESHHPECQQNRRNWWLLWSSPKKMPVLHQKPEYVYTHAYVYILFKNTLLEGFWQHFKQANLELYLYFKICKLCQTESKESIRICQCSQKCIISSKGLCFQEKLGVIEREESFRVILRTVTYESFRKREKVIPLSLSLPFIKCTCSSLIIVMCRFKICNFCTEDCFFSTMFRDV